MRFQAAQGGRKWHIVSDLGAGNPYLTSRLAVCATADLTGPSVPARTVPEAKRCRAIGCRDSWPAPLRSVG